MASKQTTLALLLLLALAAGASATFRRWERPPKPTLVIRAVYEAGGIVPTQEFLGNQTTGYATWAGKLYDFYTKQPLGAVYGVTTIVRGGPFPIVVAEFTHEIIGKRGPGQVTTYGYIDSGLPAGTLVITGGSGPFRGITGQAVVSFTPKTYPGSLAEVQIQIFAKIDD